MQDEARHTAGRHSLSEAGTYLRNKPVSFVSSGATDPLKQLEIAQEDVRNENQELVIQSSKIVDDKLAPSGLSPVHSKVIQSEDHATGGSTDLTGPSILFESARSIARGDNSDVDAQEFDRANSPTGSASSEEVILFKGRGRRREADTSIFSLWDFRHLNLGSNTVKTAGAPPQEAGSARLRRKNRVAGQEEEGILADYIANLRQNGEELDPSKQPSYRPNGVGDLAAGPALWDELRTVNTTDSVTQIRPSRFCVATSHRSVQIGVRESELEKINNHTPASSQSGPQKMKDAEHSTSDSSSSDSGTSSDELETLETQEDSYGGFDVMDWGRPSLRKKPKGSRARLDLEGSDPELAAVMKATWKNDRLKKSERKKHREEQRAGGLLGKKLDPTDLRVKYPVGITIDQVIEEIENFLAGSDPS